VLAKGEQQEAQVRIDRLHAGCVTLGLHGAAAALKSFASPRLSHEEVQAVLADVVRAVIHQAGLVRQDAA
jgi:two-component system chemotaxis response regulator CheY